ncbi:MAG: hypothetical protein DSZ00_05730 [Gammaproteobacteria bacterium]|nr:MAG: hypothetical protein DSZ00_05730 [Gammaproteobacteria bacterium]
MVGFASLSTQQTPPFGVPMRFFLTAPLFMGLAGLLLMMADPILLQGRWSPPLLALTHLWVLGMMLMVMLGALQQVVPVLVGVTLARPERTSLLSHLLLVPGILLLAAAFLWEVPWLFLPAVLLLVCGVLLVISATYLAMQKATSSHATVWGIRLALLALKLTVLLGAWLALGHAGLVLLRREWTDMHLVGGLLGWSVLLISAVAWQVVPMFQITPRYPLPLMRGFAPALTGALVLWMAGRWWLGLPAVELAGAAAVSVVLALFALATLWLQHRRKRRIADATLDFWRLSMTSLLLAIGLWWLARAGFGVPDLLLGELVAVGFIGSAILGMLYKIVPFLVWLHLTNRLQEIGELPRGIPNMKQVIPASRSRLLFRLHLAWMLLLLALPFWPGRLTLPAGALLLVIALLLDWHLVSATRLYSRHLAEIERKRPEAA